VCDHATFRVTDWPPFSASPEVESSAALPGPLFL
jgi:hypothetical protein